MSLYHSTHRYQHKRFSTSWILFNPDILRVHTIQTKIKLKSWEGSPGIDGQFLSKNNEKFIKDTKLLFYFLSV